MARDKEVKPAVQHELLFYCIVDFSRYTTYEDAILSEISLIIFGFLDLQVQY
jgi:hypothetical protein